MNIEFKQLINIDENTLNIITKWNYEWWGESSNYNYEKVKHFLQYSMQKDRIPQTYGLFLDNQIIGMCQFLYEDLDVRPDIYPWLANVYIDEKYRNKGYGRILIENATKVAHDIIKFNELFLYTKHIGLYEKFCKNLTDDINELCILQRKQIIHPNAFDNPNIRKSVDEIYGDMTKVPITRLDYEDDLFPTAISMISELLRKDTNYSIERKAENKIHVTCRGQAILLASILKAKGYSARVRSGFAPYIKYDRVAYDHWITEYYDESKKRWVLVDADEHCFKHESRINLNDIDRNEFIFGAEAYLGMRNNKYKTEQIYYASDPATLGLKASIRGLFYDFHCLMNDEIIFLHLPKYIQDKKIILSEEEYKELDNLATLLLNPDKNFDKLLEIWNNESKFRIMSGALNG